MPIRVICPSCGRVGQGPDRAIGKTVRCPECSHLHRVMAEMVMPDGDGGSGADAGGRPRTKPTDLAGPRPPARVEGGYDLDEAAARLPIRAPGPPPVARAPEDDSDGASGLTLSTPVLVGGAVGVAMLAVAMTWAIVRATGGGAAAAPADRAVASADPPPKPPQAPDPATPAPPAPAAAPEARDSRAPVAAPTAEAPVAAETRVSVFDAMQTADASPLESAGESADAARARAGASAVATRDDGGAKVLSTAEIVEESEPSVALIKGKDSSGTGFLVGPGIVATNAHVIDDEFVADLEVRFVSADDAHGVPLKAELLYEDPVRDLAFLSVKTDLKPLRIARTYPFRKGEDITVIGNPGMGDGQVLENAISRGVMSTKTRIDDKDFYQLNIAINPGNSGGPVFDSSGRVIAVATLKSTKQEATGFGIPVEDIHAALAKLAKDSSAEAERYRSKHRIRAAVKTLGGNGALMCLIIDLRRADAMASNPAIKDLLGKLEPVATEMGGEASTRLADQARRIKDDSLVAPSARSKIAEMAENYSKLRGAFASRSIVDDKKLRAWKQTHKRLITELAGTLGLEIPPGLMVAFDDHAPTQPTIVMMTPQNLGSYSSRLRPKPPTNGPNISRPPSLRDRMRRGGSGR